ncbi:hypothetical protein [Streptomyces sp. RFCAC02]|uniref:hypothetical protein n=1 Tax=Streptomyces sp. RFCAC02 TaxID=2499143 RepID=UPI00143DEDBD|nr:hypothetical protein [Streptomyces sp. RFCAC02]
MGTALTEASGIAARSRAFSGTVADWLRGRGWDGEPALGVVVWTGPAHEYTRAWLLGSGGAPDGAAAPLARAARHAIAPYLSADAREDDTP